MKPTQDFKKNHHTILSVMSVITTILGWEFLCRVLDIQVVILPPPSIVLVAIYNYALGSMPADFAATLKRVLLGLFAGLFTGVILGLVIGWYSKVKAVLQPLINITFPIPKIALLPLLIIWLGLGDTSTVALVWIGTFYIALTNTAVGVESVPPVVILAARNMGASDVQILRKVVLPASLPIIVASVRICFAISLILVVAVEMIVADEGIGYFIAYSGQLLDTDKVFAGLILSGVMGIAGYFVIDRLEAWLTPWHQKQKNVG